MRLLNESTLREYAMQFWRRQRGKLDPNDTEALTAIDAGADPVAWLRTRYVYKLPRSHNNSVSIVLMTSRDEVENLLVHDYLPNDAWMRERGLVPQPSTRRLGTIAAACLERGYFSAPRRDQQIQYFEEWAARASLADILGTEERPLIEAASTDQYEIVDGWGRLLPFAALLIQGMAFEPFQIFLAWSATSRPNLNIENAPPNSR
jgi:hypothetical protein